MQRIVCFGPGPKFKGGISNYNTSLAKSLAALPDTEVHIVSWTQQYPAIIPREFVDKSSKQDLLAGTNIQVHYVTNYNNPSTWNETFRLIRDIKPDKVVFQWAIAVQGLPLGYIASKLRKHTQIEVIFDLHFVIQKENSSVDKRFTIRGIKHAHTYIVHALKTYEELKTLFPNTKFHLAYNGTRTCSPNEKTVLKLYHPIYDLFQPDPNFDAEAFKAQEGLRKNVFLFFGFIRKYKGLHQAIQAFKLVADKREDVSLLICGESFWNTLDNKKLSTKIKSALFGTAKLLFLRKADDEKNYNPLALIAELGMESKVVVHNEFIPNEDVHKYFQVSDCGLLFYLYATPSGVESLSYNFRLPILATRVGHFPETIKDGYNGYLANDRDVEDMARVMLKFLEQPIPRENIDETAKELSWQNYALAVLGR